MLFNLLRQAVPIWGVESRGAHDNARVPVVHLRVPEHQHFSFHSFVVYSTSAHHGATQHTTHHRHCTSQPPED